MSDMYAIKTSTLTALGDAVRDKTIKFNTVDECPENPNFEIELDTSTYETYLYSDLHEFNFFYEEQIDFKELLGDLYDRTKRLYCRYEYEANSVNKYVVNIYSRNSFEDTTYRTNDLLISNYQDLNGNGSLFINLPTKTYNTLTASRSKYSSEDDEIKVKVKFWACDAEDKFIVLNKYTPLEMAEVINGLEIPNVQPIVLSNSQSYGCAGALSSVFVNCFPDKVTTKDLTNIGYMFNGYLNESIPFEINCKTGTQQSASYMFYMSYYLKNLPKINNLKPTELSNTFGNCWNLREIPEDIDATWDWSYIEGSTSAYNGNRGYTFYSCYSLRKIPMSFLNHVNPNGTYSYSIYYNEFSNCNVLDEIVGLPIPLHENGVSFASSNAFVSTVDNCYRLKDFTFETYEDGKPIGDSSHTAVKVPWKKQTIDLSKNVGYSPTINHITGYNSGITADKEVRDDATYQALKNDDDWFTCKVEYSRYNHDSAVRTINSLPDCNTSGTAGNTIKFKGTSGSATDGGAINTLTEEEKAVATKKGWTIAMV